MSIENKEVVENKFDFKKVLDQCSVEIQYKYHYVNEELCNASDEIVELTRDIAEMEIELLIATDLKDADAINDITENIKQLQISLDYQNIRYESLEDIYDELYFSIIA